MEKKESYQPRTQCFFRLENYGRKRVLKDSKIKIGERVLPLRGVVEKKKKELKVGAIRFLDKRLLQSKTFTLLDFLFTNYYKGVKINDQFFFSG